MYKKSNLISIVIPIYKVEKFLADCIDSAINQSYKNLEIILVDDGSPDNSGKIADDYAKKDKRIKVIHKKNGGLFDARNVGLAQVTGNYIMFLDSDDYLSKNCLKTLYDIAEKNNSDIVCGAITSNPSDLNKIQKTSATIKNLSSKTALKMFLYMKIKNNVAAKLYRTKTIKNLRFPATTFAEDQEYNFDAINKSKTITIFDSIVYYYRDNPDSLTRTNFNTKRMLGLTAVKNNLKKAEKMEVAICTAAKSRYFMEAYFVIETIIFSNAQKSFEKEYKQAKATLKKYAKTVRQDTEAPAKFRIAAFSSAINATVLPKLVKARKAIKPKT